MIGLDLVDYYAPIGHRQHWTKLVVSLARSAFVIAKYLMNHSLIVAIASINDMDIIRVTNNNHFTSSYMFDVVFLVYNPK